MSDSVRPHRRQPTRLLCPWDSPGKNTVVGCHFLLQGTHACEITSVMSDSVRLYGQQPTRLLRPQDSLGKNTGVGCHFLLWEGMAMTEKSQGRKEKRKKPRGSKGVVAETGLQVLSQIPTGDQTFVRDFYQQRTVQVRVNLIGR